MWNAPVLPGVRSLAIPEISPVQMYKDMVVDGTPEGFVGLSRKDGSRLWFIPMGVPTRIATSSNSFTIANDILYLSIAPANAAMTNKPPDNPSVGLIAIPLDAADRN